MVGFVQSMNPDSTKPVNQQNQQLQQQLVQLDGLLGHLSSSSGLYSKETFLSLYSCIIRMIRDHRMCGFVMTRTVGDESFETMAYALDGLPDLSFFRMDEPGMLPPESGISQETGLLLVLTDRLCVALYWSSQTQETFRMYEGGWTFNPGDVRTIVTHLINHLEHPQYKNILKVLLDDTPVDRRYDEKLNILLTSLVNGLENRNRELTLALDKVNELNRKMVEHERLAAVGQLCSVIAHEIRNPLGLIDLYAKLVEEQLKQLGVDPVQEEESSDAARQAVELPGERQALLMKNLSFIRQSASNLETILTELTSYSRPLQLQQESTDVVALVKDICQFYEPSYQEKQVALKFAVMIHDPEAQPMMVNLDAGKVRQAVINLLKNALEVSPTGSKVQVTVACRKSDKNVYIKVADQGPGVDTVVAKKLFTPYFSTKGNGTGLGLAHSRKILQAHGGSVELLSGVRSPEGYPDGGSPEGATFAIILPRVIETKSNG